MIASLVAENLACVRGDRRVFVDLDFQVAAGEALVVEGANGAGKTSLLRLIAGFLPPASGNIVLNADGAQILEGEERGRHVGWFGHQDGIKPQLSVGEQLEFFAQLYGARTVIPSALEQVGLARQRQLPCRYLSAGQKKRLGLARLMLSGRSLWLLDEPGVGLDRASRGRLEAAIAAHREAGGICVVASHGDVAVPHPLVLDFGG